ncbi:unnamed protein product [Caenorhabditis bovis]|uniref:Uncharacterized protein n=1 Tax=Caenorhabditis bovis TaxID=2654633 RepID=A0A8S1EMQ9_9PELO|nr:unnamed protein product [Caenorhabditis bovis]
MMTVALNPEVKFEVISTMKLNGIIDPSTAISGSSNLVADVIKFLVLNLTPYALLIIGLWKFGECPIEPKIPVLMAVTGFIMIANDFFTLYIRRKHAVKNAEGIINYPLGINIIRFGVMFVYLALFFVGFIFIYSKYSEREKCDALAYTTALIAFGFMFVVSIAVVLLSCCLLSLGLLVQKCESSASNV